MTRYSFYEPTIAVARAVEANSREPVMRSMENELDDGRSSRSHCSERKAMARKEHELDGQRGGHSERRPMNRKSIERAALFYRTNLKHKQFSADASAMTDELEGEEYKAGDEEKALGAVAEMTPTDGTPSNSLPMRSSPEGCDEDDEVAHSTDDVHGTDIRGGSDSTSEIVLRTDIVATTECTDLSVEGIEDECAVYVDEETQFVVTSSPERPHIADCKRGDVEDVNSVDKSHLTSSLRNEDGCALPVIYGADINEPYEGNSFHAMTPTKMQERSQGQPSSTIDREAHVVHIVDGLTLDPTQSISYSISADSRDEIEGDTSDDLHSRGKGGGIVDIAQDGDEGDKLTIWSDVQVAASGGKGDGGHIKDDETVKAVKSAPSFDGLMLDSTQSLSSSSSAGSKDEREEDTSDDLHTLGNGEGIKPTVWVEVHVTSDERDGEGGRVKDDDSQEGGIVQAKAVKPAQTFDGLILDPTQSLSSSSSGEESKDENEQDASVSLFRNITIDSTEQSFSFGSEECLNEGKHDCSRSFASCLYKQEAELNSRELALEFALKTTRAEADELRAKNHALRAENKALRSEADVRKFSFYKPSAVDELLELRACQEENDVLRAHFSELVAMNDALRAQVSEQVQFRNDSTMDRATKTSEPPEVSHAMAELDELQTLRDENARLVLGALRDSERIQKLVDEVRTLTDAAKAVVIAAKSYHRPISKGRGRAIFSVGSRSSAGSVSYMGSIDEVGLVGSSLGELMMRSSTESSSVVSSVGTSMGSSTGSSAGLSAGSSVGSSMKSSVGSSAGSSSGSSSAGMSAGSSEGSSMGSSVVSFKGSSMEVRLCQENARLRAEARRDSKRIHKLTDDVRMLKRASSAMVMAAQSCRPTVDGAAAAGVSVISVGSLGSLGLSSTVSPVGSDRLLSASSSSTRSSVDSSVALPVALPVVLSEESSTLAGLEMVSSDKKSVIKELKKSMKGLEGPSTLIDTTHPLQKIEAFWQNMFLVGVPSYGTSEEEESVRSSVSVVDSRMGTSVGSTMQSLVSSMGPSSFG
jgi:hypothetical protein